MRRAPEVALLALRKIAQWHDYGRWRRQTQPFGYQRKDAFDLPIYDELAVALAGLVNAFDNRETGVVEQKNPFKEVFDSVTLTAGHIDDNIGSCHRLNDLGEISR